MQRRQGAEQAGVGEKERRKITLMDYASNGTTL